MTGGEAALARKYEVGKVKLEDGEEKIPTRKNGE
jgi:hypothetical protein